MELKPLMKNWQTPGSAAVACVSLGLARRLLPETLAGSICKQSLAMMYPRKEKLTFLCLDIKGIVQEAAEDRSDVGDMLLLVPRKNQDIIQVNKDKLVQNLPEQVVDQCLEDSRSVGQAKGHYPSGCTDEVGVADR